MLPFDRPQPRPAPNGDNAEVVENEREAGTEPERWEIGAPGFIDIHPFPDPTPDGPFDAGDQIIRAVSVDIGEEELGQRRRQPPGERRSAWPCPFDQQILQTVFRYAAVDGFKPAAMRGIAGRAGGVREIPDATAHEAAVFGRYDGPPEQQPGKPPVKRGNHHA